MYNSKDIDEKVFIFNTLFLSVVNKHAPLKTFEVKNKSSPWMTKKNKEAFKKKK